MKKIINAFVKRSVFTNLITIGVFLAGIFSLTQIKREAFPRVDFDFVLVNTVYPGASPQEVEKLVTLPLEREIKGVDGIKTASSTSLESRSGIGITLDPDYKEKDKAIQDIKDAVDKGKVELPDDAEEPRVIEVTSARTPIIEIALYNKPLCEDGKTTGCVPEKDYKPLTETQLRTYAKQLEDNIDLLPDVANIDKRGYRDREIFVEIDPNKLMQYNISGDEIGNKLRARNLNFPGGTISEGQAEYTVRTVKEFENTQEIENVILRSNDLGNSISLKDVAVVRDDFKKKEIVEKTNGSEAIVLTILKREAGDAISLVDQVKEILKKFQENAPAQLEVNTMNDLSYYIRRRLNVLIGNVTIGLILVVVSLFLFLGWRVSLMVAIGIPFCFAFTFLFMKFLGISINLISLFGLVIVSGMLVDDAIVVGENIFRHLEKGTDPVHAAIQGTTEMVAPVTAAVSTTIAAFAPLFLIGGIMGKFMWSLPAMVILALIASLVESFTILPAHISDISKRAKPNDGKKTRFEARLYESIVKLYKPSLTWAYDHRYLVMLLTMGMLIVSLMLFPITGFILFPKSGIEMVFAKVEAPQGVNLDEMNRRLKPFEKAVSSLPTEELDSFSSRIGIHQEQVNDPFSKRGKNYGMVTIYLTPENERKRKASEIVTYLTNRTDPEKPVHSAVQVNDAIYITRNNTFIEKMPLPLRNVPPEKIQISDEFLVGGQVSKDGKRFVGYDGRNRFIVYDLQQKKKILTKEIHLRNFDAPIFFTVEPSGKFGILQTSLGKIMQIDTQSGDVMNKLHLPDKITRVHFEVPQKIMYASTKAGSFGAYQYSDSKLEKLWEIDNGVSLFRKEGQKPRFNDELIRKLPAVSDFTILDQKYAMLALYDGSIRKVDLSAGKIVQNQILSEQPIQFLQKKGSNYIVSFLDRVEIVSGEDFRKITTQKQKGRLFAGIGDYFLGAYGYIVKIPNTAINTIIPGLKEIEKVEFKQAGGGPPVGSPVHLEIIGEDFDILREIAAVAKDKLYLIDGVYDIRDNWEIGKDEYHVMINEPLAAMAGISVSQIATSLQTAFEGRVATSIKETEQEVDIRVIFPENLREKLSSLEKVMVRNQIGNLVPITNLASFKKYPGISQITHSDWRRVIYVKANIDEQKNSSVSVNTEIQKQMADMLKKYPAYIMKSGGEFEDTQESMEDLLFAMLVAVMVILGILVLQFGNLRHPRVVMTAIPLGLIGVSVAFFLHKMLFLPELVFSFLASMGVIGLAGVAVNDSIVLVDFINKLRKVGMSKREAVIGAGVFRLRAVILTTITTVFGLFPTAYGLGGNDPFLRPMALAMGWGLAFATFITLIIVPIYYSIWEDRGFVFHSVFTGRIKRSEVQDEN